MSENNYSKIIDKYWSTFSIYLLKLSSKMSFDLEIVNRLRLDSKYILKENDWFNCKKPTELTLKLSRIIFFDVVFYEDFAKMKESLIVANKLLNKKGFRDIEERLNEWSFKNSEAYAYRGNQNLGYFKLSQLPNIKYINGAHIYLNFLSPSIVTISLEIDVTDTFQNKIQDLFNSEPLPYFKFTQFSLLHGFTGYQSRPGFYRRQDELNSFIKLIEKEMIYFRKNHLNFGHYSDLSFPLIKTYLTPHSINFILNKYKSQNYEHFFESLGFDFQYSFSNIKEDWLLFGADRTSKNSVSYLVLASETDHKKLAHSKTFSPTSLLSHFANELSNILTINSYLYLIQSKILEFRKFIIPFILKKGSFIGLPRGITFLNYITSVDFKLERISKEITKEDLLNNMFTDIDNYVLQLRKGPLKLKTELVDRFTYLMDENKSYLSFFKSSFRDSISFQSLNYNHRIQSRMFWLTIFIIILSIILLIPESVRIQFYDQIKQYLINLL